MLKLFTPPGPSLRAQRFLLGAAIQNFLDRRGQALRGLAMTAGGIMLSLMAELSYAWVCPNNFSQIAVGDSIEQVVAACGKPASEKKSQAPYQGPQEWQYYVSVKQPLSGSGANAGASPSVKMSVAFVKNKAINITVQGTSLASTSLCGPTVSIGDSDEIIKKNCGNPVFVQKQEPSNNNDTKPKEIIEYKYNTTPPNTLIFEDGFLKDRK